MKTLKTLVAAVTTLVAAAAVPAHAALSLNGVELNGFRANGLALNGFRANGYTWNGVFLNGFRTNGYTWNGLSLNGFKSNGTAHNGEATAVGEIVAVSLPSATQAKCELASW